MQLQVTREELNADGSLPPFYEEDVLVLLVRDPRWMFAYWEISSSTYQWLKKEWAGDEWNRAVRLLRLYRHRWGREGETESFMDIELNPSTDNWYLEAVYPDHFYHAEVGWRKTDGRFHCLLRSNTVRTPRDRISDIIDENWTLPDWKSRRLFRRISLFNLSSPELLREAPFRQKSRKR